MLLALVPAIAIQGYNEYDLRAARDLAVRAHTMATARTVAEDYRATALSLRAHPLAFLRADFGQLGHRSCADLARA